MFRYTGSISQILMLLNHTLWPCGSKVKKILDWPVAAIFILIYDVHIMCAI